MSFAARHSHRSSASAEDLYALVADPGAWSRWDRDVRSASLNGPPIKGARGRVQPAHGPAVRFVLTEVEQDRVVVNELRLPLARVTFDHRYEPESGGGTRLTHEVRVNGLLGPLFALLVGRPTARGLPEAMQRLADLAEHGASANA